MLVYVAFALATVVPLVSLWTIQKLDFYRMGSGRLVVLAFLWGAMAAGLAARVNRVVAASTLEPLVTVQFFAPVLEEILKALMLVFLVRRPNFNYFVDGAVYGFSVGIGFAVLENYLFIADREAGLAMTIAVQRVLSANLMHGSASALVGVSLGLARFERFPRSALTFLAGLLGAIAVHMAYNNMVTRSASLYLALGIGAGLVSGAAIGLIIRRGVAEEQQWIETALRGEERITRMEQRAVNRLAKLDDEMALLQAYFDADTARTARRLLLTQAQYGILKAEIGRLPDPKTRAGAERRAAEAEAEINRLRRTLGPYVMLVVRHLIPEETSPLWGRLELLIRENAERQGGGVAAFNLYEHLEQRIESGKQARAAEAGSEAG